MARALVTMKLIGAKELEANLRELPLRLQKGTIDRALLKVGQPIADATRANVPSGTGKPVALSSKVAISKKLSRRQRAAPLMPGERKVYIGFRPSPVAHLIEFGTGPRYDKSGAYRGYVRPNPMLRPAWEGGKMAALDEFGRILGEEIEKTAARLHKRNAKKAALGR